ncbi:MAG: DNA-processing protein DprA [Phycisphaerales bacterium]|nr:DNA-processing protein DprA [Phycisphaerales bacterium]
MNVDSCHESTAMLRLLLADGIGPATARRLIDHLGSPSAVLRASIDAVTQVDGLTPRAATAIVKSIAASDPEAERRALQAIGARFVAFTDAEFPPMLCDIPDPPAVLRIRGKPLANLGPALAVVGTRRASAYGRRQAWRFASALASAGITIISGGARGIDAEAHRAAVRANGRTVVVLGSGLARPYPPEHEGLFDEVVACGGTIVSDLPVRQPPRPGQFPRRNRIVSGLSIGVLVVEAPRRSGAMITARLAIEDQGREAWAIPGSVEHHHSAGGHQAIAEGWAALVQSPDDLLQWIDDAGWFRSS